MTNYAKTPAPQIDDVRSGMVNRRGFLGTASAVAASIAVPSLFPRAVIAAPRKGGVLRAGRAHGQTTDSLDPGTYENNFMVGMAFAFQGHLTEVGADGSLLPHLAESWEASADASTWTFKLRRGVEFHSGKTLNAEDVIASINHHRGMGTKSAAASIVKSIADVHADGPDVVVFRLDRGNADFPSILSDYHLCIGPAKDGKIDWTAGDGCGPYRIDHFEPGVQTQLTRNSGYWRDDRAHFDAVRILTLLDPAARINALTTGEVDVIDRVDLKTVHRLKDSPAVVVHSVAGTQHYTFAMSCNRPPFTDVNVRLALKYAINREELLDKILRGYGEVGNDHPIARTQHFFNKDLPQRLYDPDKAKWHLKQAGLDTLEVELSAADAAFGGAVDAGLLYSEAARSAAITIKVVREPNDGYWSNVWMKRPFTAVSWSGRPIEDHMLSEAYQSNAAWNDTYWSNTRFDELLLKARSELDEAKRREMYYEMQAIVNEEGGAVVPVFASFVFATSKKIAYEDRFSSHRDMDGERWAERWWFA
jgi:peptide/nickel transport system substrate-binding protein